MSNVIETGHNMRVSARLVRSCLLRNIPVFWWGPSGIGKTETTEAIGADLGWPVVDITLSTMDPTDLQGFGYVVDGRLAWSKPTWLDELESYGDVPTVLFIDEANAGVSQAMLAACLKLIRNRRAGSHRLPAQCRIVAAGNRQQDRAAITRTTGPYNNRFSHVFSVSDRACWQDWANAHAVDPLLCAFINFQEGERGQPTLHVPGEGDQVAWPSGRSWVEAAKFIGEPEDVRVHLFASQVGLGHAAEFENFVKLYTSMPSVKSIIADPNGAALPRDIGMTYAISSALARAATRANFAAIITYGQRLGAAHSRELETVAVVEAAKRDETLKETPAYVAWALRNADALK